MRELISEYGTAVISTLVAIAVVGIVWSIIDSLGMLNILNIRGLV